MNIDKPKPGSKPAPINPAEAAAQAKAKADAAQLSLGAFVAMCEQSGVQRISTIAVQNGATVITLRGFDDKGRSVAVDVECPSIGLFPLYAMQALEEWRLGMGDPAPVEPVEHAEIEAMRAEARWSPSGLDRASIAERAAAETDPAPESYPLGVGAPSAEDMARAALPTDDDKPTPAMKAEEIAKRASPVNIHKPPPAGAGERKPLGLPLCKQCKTQPVYNPSAEVCGAECAKVFYMRKVTNMQKANGQ